MAARDEKIVALYKTGKYSLQEIGSRYNITRERVRQICYRHNFTGSDRIEQAKKMRAEQDAVLREKKKSAAIRRAKENNWTCPVCGVLNVRRGFRDTFKTCSTECSRLYVLLRPRIERNEYAAYQARSMIRRDALQEQPAFKVNHARRVLADEAVKHPERYYYREDSMAGQAFERMLELRRELGTEENRTWA